VSTNRPLTFLCLASYKKGDAFLRECHRQGVRVLFLTVEKLRDEDWPWDAIDEDYYLPSFKNEEDVLNGVSYLARSEHVDRIVPLDEFDATTAAALREHLRVPGMGETTVRFFRDKLAMRKQAREAGIAVPDFVGLFHRDDVRAFTERCAPPWILKPRTEASAIGIEKIYDRDHLWRSLDALGDRQSHFLLEEFVPGDVYHVDALVSDRSLAFADVHRYVSPPFDVMHDGGIFASRTLDRDGTETAACRTLTQKLVQDFGMVRGAVHTEFIRSQRDGEFYFLETAARVGGANIAEMVEAASGLNLWREWARIEIADARGEDYTLPERRRDYAGILISLARQEHPDLSSYQSDEVAWTMTKKHHAGLIVRTPNPDRVDDLLHRYMDRFRHDFHTSLPAPDSTDDIA
jgi:biotin carboxylase